LKFLIDEPVTAENPCGYAEAVLRSSEITDNRASLYIADEKRAEAALAEIDRSISRGGANPLVAVDDDPFLVIVVRDEAGCCRMSRRV